MHDVEDSLGYQPGALGRRPRGGAAVTWARGRALAGCVLLLATAATAGLARGGEIRGRFFRVEADDDAFGARVAAWADAYLGGIPPRFGFDRGAKEIGPPPWVGPTMGSIRVHGSREAFVSATGAPAWAGGVARGFRGIDTFLDAETLSVDWHKKKLLQRVLPHELAHHLFQEFLGPAAAGVPRWLKEGVAMAAEAQADEGYGRRLRIMGEWLRLGRALPFDRFQGMTTDSLSEAEAELFYTQAATATGYLRLIFGSRRFVSLLASLRDGVPLTEALGAATGGKVATLSDFEAGWRNYVLKTTEAKPAKALRARPLPETLRVATLLPEGTAGDLAAYAGRRILVVQWFTELDGPSLDQLRRLSDLYRREWRRLALVWVRRGANDPAELQRLLAEAGLPPPCPVVADPDGSASARLRRECGLRPAGRGPSSAGTALAVLDRRGRVAHDGPYGPVAEAAVERVLDEDASEP